MGVRPKTFIMKLISFVLVLLVFVTAMIASSRSIAAQDGAYRDMQAVLDARASLKPKRIETLSTAEAREQPTPADAAKVVLKKMGKTTDPETLIPSVKSVVCSIVSAAGQIPAQVNTLREFGPFPVIVFYHGGSCVIGDKQAYDGGALGLAKQAGAVVASADYRLAQEHKFPAEWEDTPAAHEWTLANAPSINEDPKKLSLAGESAGGNLSVATVIAVCDAGLQAPLHVLAVYPVSQTSTTTESCEKHANAKPLNRPMINWFFDKLVSSPSDLKDPRFQLTDAKLQGLPPVTIINASTDLPLSDG